MVILAEGFCDFPQYLQANARIIRDLFDLEWNLNQVHAWISLPGSWKKASLSTV
jgi:hypothetical protein